MKHLDSQQFSISNVVISGPSKETKCDAVTMCNVSLWALLKAWQSQRAVAVPPEDASEQKYQGAKKSAECKDATQCVHRARLRSMYQVCVCVSMSVFVRL